MPPCIATGPAGDPDRLKALIVARPGIVEERLRVLDVDLGAGPAGTIDIVCVDRSGALTLLGLARKDADSALVSLLDQHLWATDQLDLLRRLYSGSGLVAERPVRCLLIGPSFTHAFLRRLFLLAVPVTPFLARTLPARDDAYHEDGVLIEPAAALFGLEETGPAPRERRPATVTAEIVTDAEVDGAVLEPDGIPDPIFQEEVESDPFETLSPEELAEFERFDVHRRERGRSPA